MFLHLSPGLVGVEKQLNQFPALKVTVVAFVAMRWVKRSLFRSVSSAGCPSRDGGFQDQDLQPGFAVQMWVGSDFHTSESEVCEYAIKTQKCDFSWKENDEY